MALNKLCSVVSVAIATLVSIFLLPGRSLAHPMGNFSINHFSAIAVYPHIVRVTYIIDMAEIPAFQEMQDSGLVAQPDSPSAVQYRNRKVEEWRQGLRLRIGEQTLILVPRSSELTFPAGAGGLSTLRLAVVYEAPLPFESGVLAYEDHNYPQRAGWKEIVASAYEGASLTRSSIPVESKSQQLTSYATDLLQAPPQDLRAKLTFFIPATVRAQVSDTSPATAADPTNVREAQTPRSWLTELITVPQLTPGLVVLSLLFAMGFGALHALEPGHGKTLVAAYLVGERGTAWHALLLGLTVTASHTIGVFALGAVALFASHYIVPEQLYPWLNLVSGLLIAGMGGILLRQACLRSLGPLYHHSHNSQHTHDHHDHHHHDHSHTTHGHQHTLHHQHPGSDSSASGHVSYGTLITLGITGGMIPCPGALVVLLSAVALQRIAFGLLLIVAFSVGLAAVLVSVGLLLVSARGFLQPWSREGGWGIYLPFLAPLIMTPVGVFLVLRALSDTGLLPQLPF
jgi:ABC-type nickel/cobalt efflux system permease component RcnA